MMENVLRAFFLVLRCGVAAFQTESTPATTHDLRISMERRTPVRLFLGKVIAFDNQGEFLRITVYMPQGIAIS